MGSVQTLFGAMPFDMPPEGTALACNIVIGQKLDGSFELNQRLPSGVPFDPNNPVHVFGHFVVSNAQQLMSLAMEMRSRQQAAQVRQVDEVIATKQFGT